MNVEDAVAYIVEHVRKPPPDEGYGNSGYEVYLPIVIMHYIRYVERDTEHPSRIFDGKRSVELSPIFFDAAWDLCRRGILRPSVKSKNSQIVADGGNGYSLTAWGREWITRDDVPVLLVGSGRLEQLFGRLSDKLGPGFLQRASEAVRCHTAGTYLASCAMAGAAAESILLAVATAKSGDETATLKAYSAANGRQRTVDGIVGQARQGIAEQFRSATNLLLYWRDDAAHGRASTISEIEAHEALARLLRFAQFVTDNWSELTHRA